MEKQSSPKKLIHSGIELNIARKKTRDALSGVDLFNGLYELLTGLGFAPTGMDFVIRKFMFNLPNVTVSAGASDRMASDSARLTFHSNGSTFTASLAEGRRPPDRVYEFDESELRQCCSVEDGLVSYEGGQHHSVIQIFATISKHLFDVRQLGDPERLVLTRIRLKDYCARSEPARFSAKFLYNKMCGFNVSQVFIDRQLQGDLFWTV